MSTTYEFIEADNTVTREFMREQNTERNRIFGEFEKNSGIKWSFVLEAGIMEGGREPNLAVYSNLNCDPPISFRAYGNGADEALDNAYRIAAMISDLDGEPRKYAIFLPRNSFVAPDNKSEVGRVPGAPKKVSPSAEKVELSSPYKVTLPVSPKSGAPLVSASCQKCHDLQDQVDVLTTSNQNLTAKLSEARSEIEMTKKALTPTVYLYDSTSSRSYNKSWETNGYVYNFKAFDVVLSPEEIVRDGNEIGRAHV